MSLKLPQQFLAHPVWQFFQDFCQEWIEPSSLPGKQRVFIRSPTAFWPFAHALERISGKTEAVAALLLDAARSMGEESAPQVLLTIASRFQRLSWKYELMAYALMLKHVGVLYQTMYLVATAMELAPCAIGGGNSDLFAQVTGCDYYAETSVGEFALGSRSHV